MFAMNSYFIMNEIILREYVRNSLEEQGIIEEGILDWLFKRWRRGGGWKGAMKGGHYLNDVKNQLQNLYGAMGKLRKDYPVATRRVRNNIKRIMLDVEHLDTLISKGMTEKSFLDDKE